MTPFQSATNPDKVPQTVINPPVSIIFQPTPAYLLPVAKPMKKLLYLMSLTTHLPFMPLSSEILMISSLWTWKQHNVSLNVSNYDYKKWFFISRWFLWKTFRLSWNNLIFFLIPFCWLMKLSFPSIWLPKPKTGAIFPSSPHTPPLLVLCIFPYIHPLFLIH